MRRWDLQRVTQHEVTGVCTTTEQFDLDPFGGDDSNIHDLELRILERRQPRGGERPVTRPSDQPLPCRDVVELGLNVYQLGGFVEPSLVEQLVVASGDGRGVYGRNSGHHDSRMEP